MQPAFELFEHTADLGVRAWADDAPGLIAPATAGLYACVGELVAAGEADETRHVFDADDPAYALHDYLSELLYALQMGRRVFEPLQTPRFDQTGLTVIGRYRPLDGDRSHGFREIKAITYHELAVRQVGDRFEAVFIVDI